MLYGSPRPSNRLMSFRANFSAPGSLRAAAVTHRTAFLYRSAFCELTAFVASCSSRPLTASCSSRRVDRWLERFAEYVYEAQGGGSYQLVVRALQGVSKSCRTTIGGVSVTLLAPCKDGAFYDRPNPLLRFPALGAISSLLSLVLPVGRRRRGRGNPGGV